MNPKPYILVVGVDFTELADRALHEAFAQASQRANAEVHVLSALPVASEDPGYAISVYAALDEKPLLETAIARLGVHVGLELEKFRLAHPDRPLAFRVVSHAQVDSAAHCIVQLASDLAADLIVIGTHNPKGLERLLLGSVAEATVRDARCRCWSSAAAEAGAPSDDRAPVSGVRADSRSERGQGALVRPAQRTTRSTTRVPSIRSREW